MGSEGNWVDDAQTITNNGLGPYKVVSFEPGVEVVLKRNEDYFGGPKGKPAIKNLVIRSLPDVGPSLPGTLSLASITPLANRLGLGFGLA